MESPFDQGSWPRLNHTCILLSFLSRFSVASLQAHHADNILQDSDGGCQLVSMVGTSLPFHVHLPPWRIINQP